MNTSTLGPWRTLAQIKAANADAGHHFFSPASLRFFSSRILPGVIGGRYFITSERFIPSDGPSDEFPRLYTVRQANDDGTVDTVGDFQQYTTPDAARAAARRITDGA